MVPCKSCKTAHSRKLKCQSDGIRQIQKSRSDHRSYSANNIRPKFQNRSAPENIVKPWRSKRLEAIRQANEKWNRAYPETDRQKDSTKICFEQHKKSVQPDFSKIHPVSAPEYPLPINYCDLSDDQVAEIQLANYKALESKQQVDSSDWFRLSAPPMDEDTETSPQSHIDGTSERAQRRSNLGPVQVQQKIRSHRYGDILYSEWLNSPK